MPLFYQDFSIADTQIFVWKYDEKETFDTHKLIEPENFEKIKNYHQKKLLEILMVRKILQDKLPNHKILYRDREPYLYPSQYEISISHSYPFSVLALSKSKIGVDIEKIKPKILALKDKFTTQKEQEFITKGTENQYLTIIWSIKESLYKLHHSKHWSFKKNYEVLPFSEGNYEAIRCRVYDETFSDEFSAKVTFLEDFVISVVVDTSISTF